MCILQRIGKPHPTGVRPPPKMPDRAHKTSGKAQNPEANGKISQNVEELGMVVTGNKNTWVKSCKETAKRETEIFKMMGSLADDAKTEDGDGGRIKNTSRKLRKEENEEYEASAFLEAIQKNVDEAHARASETK